MRETTAATSLPDLSGRLSITPLFAVLRRIQQERLTGALSLSREDQSRLLFFESGELRSARSSREEHRLGSSLVRWGYLSQSDLDRALEVQPERGARLDQILAEDRLVPRSVLDGETRRLMEQIVLSALSWTDGNFHFLPTGRAADSDIAFSLSTTEMIIEGIRRVPESEQFLNHLGDLSRVPRLAPESAPISSSLRLPPELAYMLSRIDGKTSAADLLKLTPGSRTAGAKLLYTLVYCGFVELGAEEKGRPPQEREEEEAEILAGASSPHRDLVKGAYRRIDWLSHYDLLGVSSDAKPEEIEKAYRAKSRLFSPALRRRSDLADCGRELAVLSARLRLAHEVLSKPASREAYDRSIPKADVVPIQVLHRDPNGRDRTASVPSVRRETASSNYRRAAELIEDEQFFPAIQLMQEAVRFTPENADYRRLLGLAMLKNPWWQEEALEHLEEAVRLEPARADLHACVADAYLKQGRFDRALSHARTALNVAPESQKLPYRRLERRVEESIAVAHSERRRNPLRRLLRTS